MNQPERISSARRIAFLALRDFKKSAARLSELLDDFMAKYSLSPVDKRLATELTLGVIRNLRYLDYFLDHFVSRSLTHTPRDIRHVLRLAAYEIMFLSQVPDYATISQAVELAKKYGSPKLSGLVNASLRRLARKYKEVDLPGPQVAPIHRLAVKYSHPGWLVRYWVRHLGYEGAEQLMAFNNSIPPLDLRVNTLYFTPLEIKERLAAATEQLSNGEFCEECLKVTGLANIAENDLFKQGAFYIQDEGSQLISYLIDPCPGELIIDYCGTPGGKATHLAQLSQGQAEIVACDISRPKLRKIEENSQRLNIRSIKTALINERFHQQYQGKADKVLVDVPCTGLGTLRRHPELKWKRHRADIKRLAGLQLRIVEQALGLLKSGGVLIYSTCTLTHEENQGVIEKLLPRHSRLFIDRDLSFLPAAIRRLTKDGFLTTLPYRDKIDGVFATRLIKKG